MALSNEKKCRIEEKLLNGCTHNEIAKSEKVSTKTIQRIKKGLVQSNPQLAETISDNQYNKRFNNRQLAKAEHLKELQRMYEDTEEGWIYTAEKEKLLSRQMSRTFAGIVYGLDDEKRTELATKLEAQGYSGELSPIHDKDTWDHDSPAIIDDETGEVIEEVGSRYKKGDRKKSHTHIMIQMDNPLTYKKFNEAIHKILEDTPMWIMVTSVKGYHNYLTHNTEAAMKAGKYLYNENEIIRFGCFEMTLTKRDRQLIITAIASEIIENHICYMKELIRIHAHIPEEIGIIKDSSYFLKSLIDEQWREAHPNGRVSLNLTKIVDNFDDELNTED